MSATQLPDAHFGSPSTPVADWRRRPDTTPDDDEFYPVPHSVKALLGFDPAEIGGITQIPPQEPTAPPISKDKR